MKRRTVVVLALFCTVALTAVYVAVNQYAKRLDSQASELLREQRQTYAKARAKRLRESKALLAVDELRVKLGLADQPDVEIRIAEQETQERTLSGIVEVITAASDGQAPEIRTQKFRIDYDENDEIQACKLLD